jgi:hypothetical protein
MFHPAPFLCSGLRLPELKNLLRDAFKNYVLANHFKFGAYRLRNGVRVALLRHKRVGIYRLR